MNRTNIAFLSIIMLMSCSGIGRSTSYGNNADRRVSRASTYYVDANGGYNANDGLSVNKAWKSISKVNGVELKAGDNVLFKRGCTYTGELEISGEGTYSRRITVGAYGEGVKPLIIGNDTSMYAVRILNSDYLTLRDIEIVNKGVTRLAGRTGLTVECTNYGVSNNVVIDDVDIRDVNGSLVKSEGGGSGIYIKNGGEEIISTFDSLVIQNITIKECSRNAMIWSGYWERDNWYPNTNIVVRNNLIEGVPGDGIVPIGCDGALIEYNIMRDCPALLPDTEAAAGIWPWSCDNTLIQHNEVSDHKAPWDAQGFDSDYNSRNTIIQYNYSHDNEGGFILICNDGSSNGSEYNIGNIGTIVRYNISINDAIRTRETRVGIFSPTIHIAGPTENTTINNNIIHVNKKSNDEVDRSMITIDSWSGFANNTSVKGNIFHTPEVSTFRLNSSTNNNFEYNYYLGNFERLPNDDNAILASKFYQKIVDQDRTGFNSLLKLMNNVDVAGTKGIFVNKEAIHKFFDDINSQ